MRAKMWLIGAVGILSGCSAGLQGGSISAQFTGIQSATVLGPETVEVRWAANDECTNYQVYLLSASTTSSVAQGTIPPITIKAPIIQSARPYTFAVACIGTDGNLTGIDLNYSINTWPKFNGLVTASLDVTGQNPLVNLQWSYSQGEGTLYQIYAQQSTVPGDLANWQLTATGGPGTDYAEEPVCETYKTSIRIGPNGDCNPQGLNSGNIYNFKIVAKYPDGSFSTDLMGNGASILLPAAFNPPTCVLTHNGLGADFNTSYLFLRCDANAGNTACSIANMSIRAYQAVGGVRLPVSDTMLGSGTLRIEPRVTVTAANDRLVEGLEVEYTCTSTTPATKSVVRYDGETLATRAPVLKYNNTQFDTAPVQSYARSPSYLGDVMAIGDYDCNGKPDLATGLPSVTFNQAPYFNKNATSGVVKIYYNYTSDATGSITASSTQYLSFRDLGYNARFGASLSSGNVNKDVYSPDTNNYFSCDDLIIGAPGANQQANSNGQGSVFIFYGHPQKFAQPLDYSGLAINAPTCAGNITNQVCAPVMLVPSRSFFNQGSFSYVSYFGGNANGAGNNSQFGFSVAYIRDFNADGYGDVAIGDPFCSWDGEIANANPDPDGDWSTIREVGCVYVYFGGAGGITSRIVGKYPDGTGSSFNSPYVKVYPPFPQSGMHFGWSISGGGDVDGRLPVPVAMNGGTSIILANGNDFIVGAPDFDYNPPNSNGNNINALMGLGVALNWTIDETISYSSGGCTSGGACPVDPIVMQGVFGYNTPDTSPNNKISIPWNGAWAPGGWNGNPMPVPSNLGLRNSRGIAFLYLGRSSYQNYALGVKDGFNKYPNMVQTSPLPSAIESYLSLSLRDRQNGSPYLTLNPPTNAVPWQDSPLTSFYNCGPRGGPKGPDAGSGTFKHISCLAGRNNFSVVYPTLPNSSASAVSGFGAKVSIAGAKEQNAIALYELTSILGNANSSTHYSRSTIDSMDFVPYAQGYVHDRIRGTSMWELSVQGLNNFMTANTCETFNDATGSNPVFNNAGCPGYSGRLARSGLEESYNFPSSAFNAPQPAALPQVDINRDGYADVVTTAVAGTGRVFVNYGNYAADFSYSGNNYSTSPTCNVTRLSAVPNNTFSTTASPTPSPYATFYGRSAVTNVSATPDYFITTQYPQYFSPNNGSYVRLSYLNDITELNGPTFSYDYQAINRGAGTLGSNCLPLVKSVSASVNSISAADLNNDGLTDVVFGMSGYNSSQGRVISSLAGTSGNGLAVDVTYSSGGANGRYGSAVEGAHWKFINPDQFMQETSRRDLFIGSLGFDSGNGAIYGYTGAGNATLGSVPNSQFLENINSPNMLGAEKSIILGDVNGDGFDEILTPVKQVSLSGSVFYDALIYFGSPFGPVTYSFCSSKLAMITLANGSAISLSDCQGSIVSQAAFIGQTQIRLPQYLQRPSGISTSTWILSHAYPAGDVDQDGHADLVIFERVNQTNNVDNMYLFFGSDSGIVNGSPILGAASNHNPQFVTSSFTVLPYTQTWNLPHSYNQNNTLFNGALAASLGVADFNGDGYADIAVGHPLHSSPNYDGPWTCSAGTAANTLQFGNICGQGGTPPANPGPSYGRHGAVYVLYGGPYGYQTPVSGSGTPIDFDSIGATCGDFLTGCGYGAGASPLYSRDVYNSLTFNTGTGAYSVDTNLTACDPGTGACKASFIRNPLFFNNTVNGDAFRNNSDMYFGGTMTVADVNADGIDDLLVGAPWFHHYGFDAMVSTAYAGATLFGQNTGDSSRKGQVFIYYGVKGAGLVAPSALNMVADNGYALATSNALPAQNRVVFSIYPTVRQLGLPSTYPELDQASGVPLEGGRAFASSITTGDFNSDGIDDIATASYRGQLYIYYGPLCQLDNSKPTWQGTVYTNHNKAIPITAGTITPGDCTVLDLNVTLPSNTLTSVSLQPAPTKPLYPQMMYVPGSAGIHMGSILMSKRPTRAPASTTILKNIGNINGDPEGTSDLIVATSKANDPNIAAPNGKYSGLGYALFGHKAPASGDMQTQPGLYVTAGTYNGSISSQVIAGVTNFFYSPIVLKPHASDNSVDRFYEYAPYIGDFNGDGTGDVLFPTTDIQYGSDNTPVISGGGFKLFY